MSVKSKDPRLPPKGDPPPASSDLVELRPHLDAGLDAYLAELRHTGWIHLLEGTEDLEQLKRAAIAALEPDDLDPVKAQYNLKELCEASIQSWTRKLTEYMKLWTGDDPDVEDAVHDVLLKVRSFDPEKGKGSPKANWGAFVNRAVKNQMRDFWRKRKVRHSKESAIKYELERKSPRSAVDELEAKGLTEDLRQLLASTLEPKELAYLEARAKGLSYRKIAAATGRDAKTVHYRLKKVHRKLEKALREKGWDSRLTWL